MGFKNLETFQKLKKCLLKNVISSGFIHTVCSVRPLAEKKEENQLKLCDPG